MASAIHTVGIISKPRKEDLCAIVPGLTEWLKGRGLEVLYDEETAKCVGSPALAVERGELGRRADLAVVLGGDGTLLAAARALDEHDIPVLAINLGGLGFLTSFPREDLYAALELALAGNYRISERVLLEVALERGGTTSARHRALNDVVINKAAMARILDLDLYFDGGYACSYKADGIIFATPTGSTAYSLSAGGPILYPYVGAFVVTPICPHALSNRPLVVPDTMKIELVVASGQEAAFLTIDGQVGVELHDGDRVVVTKSRNKFRLVRPPGKLYFEILRAKLKWGAR
ncbi:MAG TPA: NAD(+)/NADH kinase [Candidatus Acidoferrales bacterium]|nr:NAD(+)/NADH kinase [Candidatus Acidoferrales bacterium]